MFNRAGLFGPPNQYSMLGYSPMARPGMGGQGGLAPMAPTGGTPMPAYQPQRFAPPSFMGNISMPPPRAPARDVSSLPPWLIDPWAFEGGGPGGTAGDDGGVGGDGGNGPGEGAGEGPGPGFARGGLVSAGRLAGPNPPGPDDGHAALDAGEYVVRAAQARKHQGLLAAINSGASKKQLRGLLG
jgi:hypothetical protein